MLDGAIMRIEQLLGLIVQKQQNRSSLQTLSDSLEVDEFVALFLPLAKLLVVFE